MGSMGVLVVGRGDWAGLQATHCVHAAQRRFEARVHDGIDGGDLGASLAGRLARIC